MTRYCAHQGSAADGACTCWLAGDCKAWARRKERVPIGQILSSARLPAESGWLVPNFPMGREIRGDREGGAVDLVGEEEVAAGEAFSQRANHIRKGDRLLIDLEFFEGEGHAAPRG